MADPLAVLRGLANPRHPRRAVFAALLPAGGVSTDALSTGINAVHGSGWPDRRLWLCAMALRDGRRVVFGRPGAPRARVGDAVAASCALPGYFRPVTIAGRRHVDGGIISLTNADLMAGLGMDLVIVSSPMSHVRPRPSFSPHALPRRPIGSWLDAEVAALRRGGVPTVAVEPDRAVVAAMGLNPMDARRRVAVSRATFASVRGWLAGAPEGRWLAAMMALAAADGAHGAGSERRPAPAMPASPEPDAA